MRHQGVVVYTIGLGDAINQEFLRQRANDPFNAKFDVGSPGGIALTAPHCPSPSCAAELQLAFMMIASRLGRWSS